MDKPRRRRPILGRVAYPTPNTPAGCACRAGTTSQAPERPRLSRPSELPGPDRRANRQNSRSRPRQAALVPALSTHADATSRVALSRRLTLPPHRSLRARREARRRLPGGALSAPGDIHTLSPTIDDSCGPPAAVGSHCSVNTADAPSNLNPLANEKSKPTTWFCTVLCIGEPGQAAAI